MEKVEEGRAAFNYSKQLLTLSSSFPSSFFFFPDW